MVVTDLGTEFGVEVDRSGVSRAHVFRSQIEMRRIDGGAPSPSGSPAGDSISGRAIRLGPNESATVEVGQGRAAKAIRGSGQSNPPVFVRHMPKRLPIRVFNTGVGLLEIDVFNRPARKEYEGTYILADGSVQRYSVVGGRDPMALLVELQGFALGSPSLPAASTNGKKAGTMKP